METEKEERLVEATDSQGWLNLQFDSQILGTFMSCPREMNYKFNLHLTPIGGVSKSIEKGTLAHHGLQVYYDLMMKGIDFLTRKAVAAQKMRELYPTLSSLAPEDLVLVLDTFNEYAEYRKNDVFQVVFTERLFKFIAYESFPLRVILVGRIDMGIYDGRSPNVIPVDHKSESEAWFYSTTSNQFKIYALACGSQQLIVNRFGFQKSVKPEKKFGREDLNFDADVLREFQHEVIPYYAKQMLICMEDDYYPPDYASCVRGHWGCVFSDRYSKGICTVDRAVRQEKINAYFVRKEWNPADEASNET